MIPRRSRRRSARSSPSAAASPRTRSLRQSCAGWRNTSFSAQASTLPANVTFVAADLSRTALRDALRDAHFDFGLPAFISWLGVVPYLTLDAISATLATLGSLPIGTEIVFDYGVPPSMLSGVARLVFNRFAARVAAAGEPWITFFEPAELRALLQRCGFTRVDDYDGGALTARYLANRTDGLRLGPMGHIARASVAR